MKLYSSTTDTQYFPVWLCLPKPFLATMTQVCRSPPGSYSELEYSGGLEFSIQLGRQTIRLAGDGS